MDRAWGNAGRPRSSPVQTNPSDGSGAVLAKRVPHLSDELADIAAPPQGHPVGLDGRDQDDLSRACGSGRVKDRDARLDVGRDQDDLSRACGSGRVKDRDARLDVGAHPGRADVVVQYEEDG